MKMRAMVTAHENLESSITEKLTLMRQLAREREQSEAMYKQYKDKLAQMEHEVSQVQQQRDHILAKMKDGKPSEQNSAAMQRNQVTTPHLSTFHALV